MECFLLFPLAVLLSTAPGIDGYSTGPPLSACVRMYPSGHRVDAQTSDPPYQLTISHDSVPLGENVTVTLKVKENQGPPFNHFKGLFVQARMANCKSNLPIGKFILPPDDTMYKVLECHVLRPMSALSHRNNITKTESIFNWTAPISEPGRIYFRATVVYNKTTFWTNVFSNYLEDGTDDSPPPLRGPVYHGLCVITCCCHVTPCCCSRHFRAVFLTRALS